LRERERERGVKRERGREGGRERERDRRRREREPFPRLVLAGDWMLQAREERDRKKGTEGQRGDVDAARA
jgi:hypothetical protein